MRKTFGKPRNHVAIVLDRSGSMECIRRETVDAFNRVVTEVRDQAAATGQDTRITYVSFANTARLEAANVLGLPHLAFNDYRPDGMTALWDAVGLAHKTLSGFADAGDPDTSFLVFPITDGDENISGSYSPAAITRILTDTQRTDRWSWGFQLPPGRKVGFVSRFGIPSDNVREWEATAAGMRETATRTSAAVATYYAARSKGETQVPNLFVTTDLSAVTARQVTSALTDYSGRFKLFDVPQEAAVKEFVEAKTKRPYVVGSAYYQLMKAEKVQPQKGVLVMEKGKKAVWGGPEARRLIGLPEGAHARVVPGNHSAFDLFVQSTSINRKLPRGTKVLVDVNQTRDAQGTWDWTTALTAAAAKRAAATTAATQGPQIY